MTLLKAILMGFIQGLTEFLPVSSSGHLVIFKNIFGLDLEGGILFDIILHIGTIIAIFIAYATDIKELIIEGIGIIIDFFKKIFTLPSTNKNNIKVINTPYRRFVMFVIVASIPTAIIGFILEDIIEGATLLIPGICLMITGLLLLGSSKIMQGNKKENEMKYKDSFAIGVVQGFATLPGISRSGSTLVAGLICGLDKEYAIKFSFIMSIPAILGAALLKLTDVTAEMAKMSVLLPYLCGMITSAIVGYICIKTLLKIVQNNKIHYFSYYCFAIGVLAIIGNFIL